MVQFEGFTQLTSEIFMGEIYENNIKEKLSVEQFRGKVKMVSRP